MYVIIVGVYILQCDLEPAGGFEDHNCTTLEDLEAVNCKRSKYEIKVERGQSAIRKISLSRPTLKVIGQIVVVL